jgi:hypothetical protein
MEYRSVDLELDEPFDNDIKSLSYFVPGEKDEVIKCKDNLNFISKHVTCPKKVIVGGHRIPIDIFEKHVKQFFGRLNKKTMESKVLF